MSGIFLLQKKHQNLNSVYKIALQNLSSGLPRLPHSILATTENEMGSRKFLETLVSLPKQISSFSDLC